MAECGLIVAEKRLNVARKLKPVAVTGLSSFTFDSRIACDDKYQCYIDLVFSFMTSLFYYMDSSVIPRILVPWLPEYNWLPLSRND